MRKSVRRSLFALAALATAWLAIPAVAFAQTGTISGHIADSARSPLAASLRVLGPGAHGAYADAAGEYTIPDVPVGLTKVEVRFPGFKTDTFAILVAAAQTVRHNVLLHESGAKLAEVRITRAGVSETKANALETQKAADNIVSVISGDEIRSLPNYNAAEAAARLPGVTAERDEGEGKYVEIRGTPPDFQHVTIDGADVPGTLATDVRAVKLDDIPADLIGSIEVSKTLSADQDASAIGGSVNIVSKIPEGTPHGYLSGTYGYQEQETNNDGTAGITYGGRLGSNQKLGFLLSGSYDRINRTLNDVEPSFTAVAPDGNPGGFYAVPNGSAYSHVFPSEWSQREYNYYRTRYGLGGDLDYRFSPTSSISVKGLWSAFFDQANRWETNLSGDGNAFGGDSVANGVASVPGGKIKNTVANRGPVEHTWGFVANAKHDLGPVHLSFDANYAGSEATTNDHLEDTYKFAKALSGFTYGYNGNNTNPAYLVSSALRSAIATPGNYSLSEIDTQNENNSGQTIGAKLDALIPFSIGDLPASFKVGLKYRNEHKGYADFEPQFTTNSAPDMTQFVGAYSVPSFYQHLCPGCFTLAPFGSIPAAQAYFHANQANFTGVSGQTLADNLATFAGTEQVAAAYVMQTLDAGPLQINAGLRVEQTTVGYVGHITDSIADTLGANVQHGSKSYTDLFPSVQLRYALDANTNVRAAVTRGIARPDYILLAPSLNATSAEPGSQQAPITLGNPALKPEHAWNYDLLAEHYFPSVGVLSGGVFYKNIDDFIFQRTVLYTGPLSQYSGFYASQYQNGPSAHLWGIEADYSQHLTFLPGALAGIGFDVNWTHVESRATVPVNDSTNYQDAAGNTIYPYKTSSRHAALDRTVPNMYNISLLYDYSAVSTRVSGQYTAATINQYGADGTSNPQSSDNYFYPHWQVDAELTWRVFGGTALTVAGQNINNEYFGFFTGTPGNRTNNQRETYGSVWLVGVRQAF